MNQTKTHWERWIIVTAVAGVVLCIALIGRRWAERERTRRPDPLPVPVPAQVMGQAELQPRQRALFPFTGTTINSLALTPNGKHLLVAGSTQDRKLRDQPVIRVWDVDEGREMAILKKDDEVGRHVGVAVSSDGKYAVAVGVVVVDGKTIGNVSVWDLESHKPIWSDHTSQEVSCVVWSPDASQLATGDMAGNIMIWRVAGGPVSAIWPTHGGKDKFIVTCLAWSNDGKQIASAETSGAIRIWNVVDHLEIASITPPDQFYVLVAFSANDSALFGTGRREGDVWFWDFKTGREWRSLTKHPVAVGGLVLGNADKLLVTVTNDALVSPEPTLTARGWDTVSGQQLWVAAVPTDDIILCPFAISKDMKRLALGDLRKVDTGFHWSVTLFDLPPPP